MSATALDIQPVSPPRKTAHTFVTAKAAQVRALRHMINAPHSIGFDIETTSLEPAKGRISLMQFYSPAGAYVFDVLKHGIAHLVELLGEGSFLVFNAKFEGSWLQYNGVEDPELHDVGMMARAVQGGDPKGLKGHALDHLGLDLDKDEQASDWAQRPLTPAQLTYAMEDAVVTFELYEVWDARMTPEHWEGYQILNDLWKPVVEIEATGLKLDRKAHQILTDDWARKKELHLKVLNAITDRDDINWNSGKQVSDYFKELLPDQVLRHWPTTVKSGHLSLTKSTIAEVYGYFKPAMRGLLDNFMDYRFNQKYLSSFGTPLLERAEFGGVIRARLNIARAATGRFSSSDPNIQQIPKSKLVRASFIARPGTELAVADYSAIEVRVLAALSGDEQLLYDVIHGDPHAAVAAQIYGRKEEDYAEPRSEELDKERSAAKATGFGIIYGSQARGLAYRLRVDIATAQAYIDGWRARYPKAYEYRFKMKALAEDTGYIPMGSGRTIKMGRRPSITRLANYPVQGTAADVIHVALIELHNQLTVCRRNHAANPKLTRICGIVHDELIVQHAPNDGEIVRGAIEQAMIYGWNVMFPDHQDPEGLVEAHSGASWAEAKG